MSRADAKEGLAYALKLFAISFLALELAYVIVGNAVLMTGLLKRLGKSDTVGIDYDRAWTILPGRIHGKNVSVHAQDTAVQWVAKMDEGELTIALGDLATRTFHLTRLRGQGFVFRIRRRVPAEALQEPRVAALPPIPGYATAEESHEPPKPEPTDENYDLWTVHLEDVDAELRELWIQEYRYVGAIHVRGGFYYRPLRRLEIGPARFDVREGELRVAEQRIIDSIEAGAEVSVEPFDPRHANRSALAHFSGHAWTTAQVDGLEFTRLYLGSDSKVRFADGSGAFESDVRLDRGVFVPGSRVAYRTSRLDIRSSPITTSVQGEVRWSNDAVGTPSEASGRLVVWIPHATFYRADANGTPASADDVRLELRTPVDLAGPLNPGAASAEVGSARLTDLRWLERASAKGDGAPVLTGGSAVGSGRIDVTADGKLSGEARVRVADASVEWKDIRLRGNAAATFDVVTGKLSAAAAQLRSRVEFRDVDLRRPGGALSGWWATVDAAPIEMRAAGGELDAMLSARCRDARLVTEMLVERGALPEWLAGLLAGDGATATARLVRRGDVVDLTLLHAEGGGTSAAGRIVRRSSDDVRGAFLVVKGPASAGVSFGYEGSGLRPLADRAWLREQMPNVAGSSAAACRAAGSTASTCF